MYAFLKGSPEFRYGLANEMCHLVAIRLSLKLSLSRLPQYLGNTVS